MPRFEAYIAFMTKGDEILPLGAFSPMGRRQPDYLDTLLKMKAESIAETAASKAASRLNIVPDIYKLALVVVDAPEGKNTWTHRHVTDAEWRLENKYDDVPISSSLLFTRWVTVQLWTDEEPTPQYIQQETQTALFRAAHRSQLGVPSTLQDYLRQEGRALAFANCPVELEQEDLEYSRQVLAPLLQSSHYPTCFAALYGDKIAKSVGYSPLGLSARAGFQVGLADALVESPTRELFFENALN